MESLLESHVSRAASPDCAPADLAAFAYEQIAWMKTEEFSFVRWDVHGKDVI
jgi:hypothetical protein